MDLHIPVLLKQVLEQIEPDKKALYVDATLGYAGHARAILEKNPNLKLIGFDQDDFAIKNSRKHLEKFPNSTLIKSNFENMKTYLEELAISEVDYFLFDLGISSVHVDDAQRGFSYNKDALLDMRMDQNTQLTAQEIINHWDYQDLLKIFNNYADVKLPHVIAKAIIKNRPLYRTMELVDVIKKALPAKVLREKNPAKTVFQALRIAVNREFEVLEKVLPTCLEFMRKNSKLMVITFHSKEDKIVKDFFGKLIKNKHDSKLPLMEVKEYKVKSFTADKNEIETNKRARSAKLRVLQKL
ncbi:16S rRNA (cytosine(1402)-N(4))-methyltransferase [Mycoplasmopsis agassizii]|uniref:Ribosomal RNA small subunit methyltransferase H n=1 Tax=Mycoplasmopsis agassizii TaxID=33922 RepID=A0A269TJU4_9BACT|nr:16S rRNA (cytosine(1402)-N(4))-methyltransferase RsmH [Mycoplasmopsis agassizii]PAK21005.1 16S rRNA (cytosine(1402)-N(4))-methyltransferase [Mycoplasmopsis agassizii]